MSSLRRPQRYQLNKQGAHAVQSGHPWIFRKHLSSAADVFEDGQWLQLVGPNNQNMGIGVLEKEGWIGIRILIHGQASPEAATLRAKFEKALEARENLRKYADSFRVVHGENDGFPAVVLDLYGKTLVLQSYSHAVDALGRYLAALAMDSLGPTNVIWKVPSRRRDVENKSTRVLRGHAPQMETVQEGKLTYRVPIAEGQKSGAFLDLRGLRKWVSLAPLKGKRVLNLFSYTGTLGLAAELAGAKEVWNVDTSQGALDFGRKHHQNKRGVQRWVRADIFPWLKQQQPSPFDLVIVDPPNMASKESQVKKALETYGHLYRNAKRWVAPKGTLVGACCTARISRRDFKNAAGRGLGRDFEWQRTLGTEDDHPIGFPQGEYLKVDFYRRRSGD